MALAEQCCQTPLLPQDAPRREHQSLQDQRQGGVRECCTGISTTCESALPHHRLVAMLRGMFGPDPRRTWNPTPRPPVPAYSSRPSELLARAFSSASPLGTSLLSSCSYSSMVSRRVRVLQSASMGRVWSVSITKARL